MEKKIVLLKDIDLTDILSTRTELVKIIKSEFDTTGSRINEIKLELGINLYRVPESSRDWHRRIRHRKLRYSAITGQITCQGPEYINYPISPGQIAEFHAMEDFCEILHAKLGLDKSNSPEEELPPDELSTAIAAVRKLENEVFSRDEQIKALTARLEKAAKKLKDASEAI